MALGPMFVMPKKRDRSFKIDQVRAADGTTKIAAAAGDIFYFKVWITNDTPTFECDSSGANANGSIVVVDVLGDGSTTDTELTITIAAEETTSLTAGDYAYELLMYDLSADHDTQIVRGVFRLEGTAGGTIS